jgi:flagellin
MGLRIQTNELSIQAQRTLGISNDKFGDSVRKLSSGYRINKAADDPAGLAVSDSLTAEVRSLMAARRNTMDGISLIQVFEGGTNELTNMMIRMRELSIQAASDTIGDRERGLLQNEVSELIEETDRIAQSTRYAGKNLLSGEATEIEIQVGIHNDPEIDRILFDPGDTDMTAGALGVDGVSVLSKEEAQDSLEILDESLFRVNEVRARVGAVQNRLQNTANAQSILRENLVAARSRIRDTDVAEESSQLAKYAILRQAGTAVLAQANQTPALALSLLQ